jgi:hypothetical protein
VDPGTFPTGKLYEMVKTTNAGVNWSNLASTPSSFGNYVDAEPDFFGDYDTTLAVDPSNPDQATLTTCTTSAQTTAYISPEIKARTGRGSGSAL